MQLSANLNTSVYNSTLIEVGLANVDYYKIQASDFAKSASTTFLSLDDKMIYSITGVRDPEHFEF